MVGEFILKPIKKAYGYVTRLINGKMQLLVFQHPIQEAGIQIPKGTVKEEEDPRQAVIREVQEETGLTDFTVDDLLAEDTWENDDGAIHHRYFYKISCKEEANEWSFLPTGGGEEDGLVFRYFWISNRGEVDLIRGHDDYFHHIFKNK